jgi:predicted phosphodiesterase
MIRLALLSDIHSNLPAFEAVLDDLKAFAPDNIVVAGDVVNWGPFSAQVMDRLLMEQCIVIRGNNELYLTDWQTERMPDHWRNFALPPFTLAQLSTEHIDTIATWPDTLSLRFPGAPAVRVVHGSARSAFEPIYSTTSVDDAALMLDGVTETTVLAAHSHLVVDRQIGRWHLINAGSVGNPLDGDLRASYMILERNANGWRAVLRKVPFDTERLYREFERTGFVEQCGVVGHLVVKEYHTAQMEVSPFLEWHRATCPDEPMTMALLHPYSQVDRLAYCPPPYRINPTTALE